jgi:hypothetical protein
MTTAQATCEIRCRCGQALYALSSEEETVLCLACGERAAVPRDVRTKAERASTEKLVTCKGCGQESALPEDTSDGHDCPHCNKTIIYGRSRAMLPAGVAAGSLDPDGGTSAKNKIALFLAAFLLIGLGVLIKIGASSTKASGTYRPPTTTAPAPVPTRPPAYQPPTRVPPPPKYTQPIRPPPPRTPPK